MQLLVELKMPKVSLDRCHETMPSQDQTLRSYISQKESYQQCEQFTSCWLELRNFSTTLFQNLNLNYGGAPYIVSGSAVRPFRLHL